MMSLKTSNLPLKERLNKEVHNEVLRRNLIKAQNVIGANRKKMMDELGHFEQWRELSQQIRNHVIGNIDGYLYQLSEKVVQNGGHVYFAKTAEEATNYISNVCRAKNAKKVVKSKSMVTEEIGLNEALQALDIKVLETDLGEFVLQIVGDRPSHIVVPAIHLSRTEIRQRLHDTLGYEGSETPEEMTAFIRKTLREDFLTADVGISGCNFAIPETGTLCLVTNEGNLRLATTTPKTHIAVMGMDRMAPNFENVDPLLTLLPRSAVGSRLTSYNTWLTGPRLAGEIDGPEEFHLVIVDNGRSDLLTSEFNEMLRCIRCGACMNICPAYRQIGGHGYGSIYPGPMGAVLTPILGGYKEFHELPNICSLCTACDSVCPVKIPLSSLILKHRENIAKLGYGKSSERLAIHGFTFANNHPFIWDKIVRTGNSLLNSFSHTDNTPRGFANVAVVKEWTKARDLPRNEHSESFRSWFKKHKENRKHG
ncbi:LutB/LldF family L-lactate oxidation iron-sulfur protein [Psittacicella gerlachiana]|uniref:Iron-sulfur cluster-binding protein n=1 Tax=Psittacicella gerlachiana TaxID=2028574 RepID=A0A3A1YL71_9GAMM|nr:LutB/LldF family L-lactate oxidation iron-sulfur protein [Psittacicella gerlachiana]RIY36757.1 iron-sulfur cluster-binding protein [Psittacicella gerlachiana]